MLTRDFTHSSGDANEGPLHEHLPLRGGFPGRGERRGLGGGGVGVGGGGGARQELGWSRESRIFRGGGWRGLLGRRRPSVRGRAAGRETAP